jgi:hypothetical protein
MCRGDTGIARDAGNVGIAGIVMHTAIIAGIVM